MWSQWVQLPPQGWVLVELKKGGEVAVLCMVWIVNCYILQSMAGQNHQDLDSVHKLAAWKVAEERPQGFHPKPLFGMESYKRFCFASAFEWILACLAWSCISIILDLLDGSLAKISRAFYVSREFNEVNHVPTMPELSQLTIQSLVARIIPLFWCLRLSRAASTWKTRTLRRSSSIVWKRHLPHLKMKDESRWWWRQLKKDNEMRWWHLLCTIVSRYFIIF